MLVSPNHHHQSQSQNSSSYSSQTYYDSACGQHAPPPAAIYPSMSVNVSMNMTMHGYGSDASVPMQCSQVTHSGKSTFLTKNAITLYLDPYFRCNGHHRTAPRRWMSFIHHFWAPATIQAVLPIPSLQTFDRQRVVKVRIRYQNQRKFRHHHHNEIIIPQIFLPILHQKVLRSVK